MQITSFHALANGGAVYCGTAESTRGRNYRWFASAGGERRRPGALSGRAANLAAAQLMPRDGAIIFGDLIGKLDVLRVECEKCGRAGRYSVRQLIERKGREVKVIDWKDETTADCPRWIKANYSDQCGARCPDLPKVL
jgi:hypothetical protein